MLKTEPIGTLGGVGLSQVRVYATPAMDGESGGTPHLHLACTELYFPLRGCGAVEFLSSDGPQRIALQPGSPVQFTPGTVHRLVNEDALEVLVIMESSHLNEEGDVVFAFPDEDLEDPETYQALAWTGPEGAPDMAEVERRRDRAVQGFTERCKAWEADPAEGRERLRRLHELAINLVAPAAAHWAGVIQRGPMEIAAELAARAAAVADGDARYLEEARVVHLAEYDDQMLTHRMCGDLWPYKADDNSGRQPGPAPRETFVA